MKSCWYDVERIRRDNRGRVNERVRDKGEIESESESKTKSEIERESGEREKGVSERASEWWWCGAVQGRQVQQPQ